MEKNNKVKYLKIRCTEGELEFFKSLYLKSGSKSLSEFIRFCILTNGHTFKNPVELFNALEKCASEFSTLKNETNRVGTNINQIAQYLNRNPLNENDLYPVIEEFKSLLVEYNKLLPKKSLSENELSSVIMDYLRKKK